MAANNAALVKQFLFPLLLSAVLVVGNAVTSARVDPIDCDGIGCSGEDECPPEATDASGEPCDQICYNGETQVGTLDCDVLLPPN